MMRVASLSQALSLCLQRTHTDSGGAREHHTESLRDQTHNLATGR